MGSIRSSIELQDNFTGILMNVINAVNTTVSGMERIQSVMSTPADTAAIEGIRDQLNQATLAVREMEAAMQDAAVTPVPDLPAPAQVPFQWQSGGPEVSAGNGMERFRQEAAGANAMLEQLCRTQDAIARQAFNTNILPPEAFRDLNALAVRMDTVRNRIREIGNNPLNIGTDGANEGLEQLRSRMGMVIQEQERLGTAMQDMDAGTANESYLRLQQIIGGTEMYIRDNVDEQGRFNREIGEGVDSADSLMQKIRGTVAAYATAHTLSKALNLSDQLVSTTARLDMMNDGMQTTQELQDMIFLSAERARGSWQSTSAAVSKLGLMAGESFGSSEEIVAFMEQINKQFAIAGTEASGIDAAMLQLTQAMGSGVLRGEEYNSILEQAPNIIQSIADYMEVPKGKLKDMAAEGLITADIVKAAMFAAAEETNARFESMPMTFGQIWTSFGNHALRAFQPVLQRLNDIANSGAFQAMVNSMIMALSAVAQAALEIFDLMAAGTRFMADNWSVLSPVIYGVTAALAVYCGAVFLYNVLTGIAAVITGAKAFAGRAHAAAIYMEAGATFRATVAQYGFNAALLACPVTWIVIAIVALIVVLFLVCSAIARTSDAANTGFGIICGIAASAAAFVLNIAIALFNAVIQNAWNMFVLPFIRIIEWVLNAANGGFNSFGDAVANLIGQIISWFLSLGMVVTRIIDAIFGTDWTAGLTSLQNRVVAWGKNENAITLDRDAPVLDHRFDYGDAFKAGAAWGDGMSEKMAGFLEGFPGMDEIPETGYPEVPQGYEGSVGGALDNSGVGSGVNDIAGNTGAIADSMDITQEELKYLRDIAEQEAVNRFTTAEISIEQINNNSISGGMDLDGVVSGLDAALGEAIDIMTEGVHK